MPFFTVRKRSCRKVMFLHMSVNHSVHRGVCIPACIKADTPRPTACWDTLPPRSVNAGIHAPPAATAADGTHPTGIHSCYVKKSARWKVSNIPDFPKSSSFHFEVRIFEEELHKLYIFFVNKRLIAGSSN